MSLGLTKCLLCMFLVSRRIWAWHWTRISCQICYCLGYFACELNLCQLSSSFAGSWISCCLIQNFTSNPACMCREPIYILSAICSEILSLFQEDGRNRQMEHGQLSEASQVTLIIHLSYTLQQVESCRLAFLRLLLSVLVNYYFSQFSILISLKKILKSCCTCLL